jgi:hypothetical protein
MIKYLDYIVKYAVPIILIVVSVFFIFSKVEDGKKIEGLEKEISESKTKIEMYEAQVLSHATEVEVFQEIIKSKDSIITDLDTEILEVELAHETEHAEVEDLKPDQYQPVIDKYYPPKSDMTVADLDEGQAVGVIHAAIDNAYLRETIEVMKIQRIELRETIDARDEVIASQRIQLDLQNEQILEYKNIEVLSEKKYKKLFRKYRRQKWLVRGTVAVGVAAIILMN